MCVVVSMCLLVAYCCVVCVVCVAVELVRVDVDMLMLSLELRFSLGSYRKPCQRQEFPCLSTSSTNSLCLSRRFHTSSRGLFLFSDVIHHTLVVWLCFQCRKHGVKTATADPFDCILEHSA